MSMEIYDYWICGEAKPDCLFTMVCTKYKGHKGDHVDSTHPDFPWE